MALLYEAWQNRKKKIQNTDQENADRMLAEAKFRSCTGKGVNLE